MAFKMIQEGMDVTALARGKRLADLKEHGLVLENGITGEIESAPVKVVEALKPDDKYDLIMVVMRKNQALQILDTLAANKHGEILFMMNNVSGFKELTDALGKERIMVGFPLPGGRRKDHMMQIIPATEKKPYTIPIGEVDGTIKPRTKRIAQLLEKMEGYKVEIRKDMDAWLKYHAAVLGVSFTPALFATDIDVNRFAETRDAIVLAIRGIRAAFAALKKAGVPMSPKLFILLKILPEPLLVLIFKNAVKEKEMEISGEGHLRDAKDEMLHLIQEFREFVRSKGVETPFLDSLWRYAEDPNMPLLPEGSKEIPVSWKGVGIFGGIVAAIIALLIFL